MLEVESLVTGLVDQVLVDLAEGALQVERTDGTEEVAEDAGCGSGLETPIVDSK